VLLRSLVRQRREKARLTAQLATTTQTLRDSEQRREMMFSGDPYPMWVYDCETLRFLEVNDAAARTYGYSREEFLGMTLMDIRTPDDMAAFIEAAPASVMMDTTRQGSGAIAARTAALCLSRLWASSSSKTAVRKNSSLPLM
jgi:PAS domain-containing protein